MMETSRTREGLDPNGEGLSYGELADIESLGVGDWVITPSDGRRQIVAVRTSPGDDAENPMADVVRLDNGREWFRDELYPVYS